MIDPVFTIDIWMVPFSDLPVWKYSYFAQIFSSETKTVFICKLCLQTAKRIYKKIKEQYMDM